MLEHLSIYTFIFGDNIFISMYIMCVCLFSAFSRRVGAVQISIIIMCAIWLTFGCHPKLMLALPFGFCLFSVFRLVFGPFSIFAICLCSVRFCHYDELMLLVAIDTIKCCYSYFDSLPTGQVTELEF